MMTSCECTPDSVHVVFPDVPASEWAIGGKFLAPPREACMSRAGP
ncbi:tautomerase family protein [Cupriavidus sp. PET2-C1]